MSLVLNNKNTPKDVLKVIVNGISRINDGLVLNLFKNENFDDDLRRKFVKKLISLIGEGYSDRIVAAVLYTINQKIPLEDKIELFGALSKIDDYQIIEDIDSWMVSSRRMAIGEWAELTNAIADSDNVYAKRLIAKLIWIKKSVVAKLAKDSDTAVKASLILNPFVAEVLSKNEQVKEFFAGETDPRIIDLIKSTWNVDLNENIRKYIKNLLLLEKIEHPPIKPMRFIERFIENSDKFVSSLFLFSKYVENFYDKELLRYFLNDSTRHDVTLSDLEYFEEAGHKIKETIQNVNSIIKLIKNPETSLYHTRKFTGYVIEHIQRLSLNYEYSSLRNINHIIELNVIGTERFKDYAENYYKDESGISEFIKRFSEISAATQKYIKEVNYVSHKLSVLNTKMYKSSSVPERPEESDDIETIYHTSAFATQLFHSGFSKEGPGEIGLGGNNMTKSGKPAVSFTTNFYVAKEIARALKEAIMIAKGELKLKHLIQMMKEDDVYNDLKKYLDYECKDAEDNPVKVFELYRYYLSYAEKGHRYDPLFFGAPKQMVDKFRQQNVENVGILAAKVDMTNKDITYLSSMDELRAPVDAILSIDKLIK